MNFNIVEMDDLTGRMAHIYSILPEGEEFTLLEQFFEEIKQYKKESTTIIEKLTIMGNETGCRRGYFKHYEGALGDGVAALSVGCIRLYCLYFDKTAVFFGSGGYKPPEVHAYQEVPELDEKAQQMREIAKKINDAIKEKDIVIEDDGSLTINYWDNESD